MSRNKISMMVGIGAVVSILGTGGCSSAGDAAPGEQSSSDDSEAALITADQSTACANDILKARNASAKYRDVTKATADGFVQVSPCISDPTGVTPGSVGKFGTVGIHYFNQARVSPVADAANPDILVYVPDSDGSLKLVATEYVIPIIQDGAVYTDASTPPTHPQPVPSLFGQKLLGPVAPHFPGGPWHYEVHAWVWSFNPNGLTAPSSPKVSCTPQ